MVLKSNLIVILVQEGKKKTEQVLKNTQKEFWLNFSKLTKDIEIHEHIFNIKSSAKPTEISIQKPIPRYIMVKLCQKKTKQTNKQKNTQKQKGKK